MDRKVLGDALLKAGKISQENLKSAFSMQDKLGGDFAPLLIKLGYVKDQDLTEVISQMEGIGKIDISGIVVPKKLVNLISREIVERYCVIPISKQDDVIRLVMSDADNLKVIEEVQFMTGCRVEPLLAPRGEIRKALAGFLSEEKKEEEKKEKLLRPLEEAMDLVRSGQVDSLEFQKVVLTFLLEKKIISPHELTDRLKAVSRQKP